MTMPVRVSDVTVNGTITLNDGGRILLPNGTDLQARLEQAEARAAQAEARLEQAEARAAQAEARLADVESRIPPR